MADQVRNPKKAIMDPSEDHDHPQVAGYELDIVNKRTGVLVQTLEYAKTPLVDGKVVMAVNVRPEQFDEYVFIARTTAGAIESENSLPSDPWLRAPGKPGQPLASA